ncbi:uncharacterized protein [Nicotiana sylvestris]|uniref:uncharacterized protein n=1 Tax=Nicotiana sylvestris TaxID=4096 RepID=UPI00388C4EBC
MTDPSAVPWNYQRTLVTYKGREVTGELPENTFIGRYSNTQELNNATQKRFPPRKPVSIEEAEAFFQKMKMPDYEVVDQLHKYPEQCQVHGDLIHAPHTELHPMSAPWPFVAWGMDVIGLIEPKASNGHRFILVAIDYFTKWVEAVTLKSVTKKVVVDFITHRNSTPYRPKANGVLEAENKNIKKILRNTIQSSRQWHEQLPFALLEYRTTVRTSVVATPYLLVYGIEAVIPAEVEIPSLRTIVEA